MAVRGKQEQAFPSIAGSSYYWEQIAKLESLLAESRSPHAFQTASELFGLQRGIIFLLSACEKTVRDGKRLKKEAEETGDVDEQENLAITLPQNKALVSVIQSIADGLAWRVLDFDRAFIRVMSSPKKPRGSVDFSVAYPGMEDVAIRFMYENGSRVVFNDITHYLRIGDLTEIQPSGQVIVHELKKDGRTVKNAYTIANQSPNAGVSKQLKNLVTSQKAFDERKIRVGDETTIFEEVGLPFANNLAAISDLISEARKSFFARRKFGDYLEVLCQDAKATISHSLNHGPQFWRRFDHSSSFDSSDLVVPIDSLASWNEEDGDFPRNKAPYSIYPFSISDCLGLLSGELLLKSRLNLSALHRMYKANGWKVSPFGIEQFRQEYEANKHYARDAFAFKGTMKAFTISRNGFNMDLSLAMLFQIATDFVKPDLLLATAEHIYSTSSRDDGGLIVLSFASEKDVWI